MATASCDPDTAGIVARACSVTTGALGKQPPREEYIDRDEPGHEQQALPPSHTTSLASDFGVMARAASQRRPAGERARRQTLPADSDRWSTSSRSRCP